MYSYITDITHNNKIIIFLSFIVLTNITTHFINILWLVYSDLCKRINIFVFISNHSFSRYSLFLSFLLWLFNLFLNYIFPWNFINIQWSYCFVFITCTRWNLSHRRFISDVFWNSCLSISSWFWFSNRLVVLRILFI